MNIKTKMLLVTALLTVSGFTASANASSYSCRLNCWGTDDPSGFDLHAGLLIYRDGSVYGATAYSTKRFAATREGCVREAKRMCDQFKIPLLPDPTFRPLKQACGSIELVSEQDFHFPFTSDPTAFPLIDAPFRIACSASAANN